MRAGSGARIANGPPAFGPVILLGRSFILGEWVVMLHLNGQIWFDAGYRRQDVIQNLLRRHSELPSTSADF